MTIEKVKNTKYNLQTFAGDSGIIRITNIPTESNNFIIYLEVNGRVKIVKSVELNGADNCTFEFTPDDTLALGVGNWEYGIKICNSSTGEENTFVPDLRLSSKALFIVYPEKAEGLPNG